MDHEKPRMLVAHPSLDIRTMLVRRFEGMGCAVQSAETGEQGIALARLARPAVALVGIGLNGGQGIRIAEKIREISPGTRVMVTPIREDELRREVTSVVRRMIPKSPLRPRGRAG